MVAMDPSTNPTFLQFFAWRLGKAMDRQAKSKAYGTVRVRTILQTTVRLILHLAGFASLTIAGFTWSIAAGLVVAGASFFVLSWLTASNPPPDSDRPQR